MNDLVEIFNSRKRRGQCLAAQNVATDKTMWTIGKGKHLYWLDKSRRKFQHGSDPITKMWGKPTTAIIAKSV